MTDCQESVVLDCGRKFLSISPEAELIPGWYSLSLKHPTGWKVLGGTETFIDESSWTNWDFYTESLPLVLVLDIFNKNETTIRAVARLSEPVAAEIARSHLKVFVSGDECSPIRIAEDEGVGVVNLEFDCPNSNASMVLGTVEAGAGTFSGVCEFEGREKHCGLVGLRERLFPFELDI